MAIFSEDSDQEFVREKHLLSKAMIDQLQPGSDGKIYNATLDCSLIDSSFWTVLSHISINRIWPLAEVASPHERGCRSQGSISVSS